MSTIKVDQVNVYTPNTNGVNFANGLFTLFPPIGYVSIRFVFVGNISSFLVHCTL